MTYSAVTKTPVQFVDVNGYPYSGAVLKPYRAGTTTPISFSSNGAGAPLYATITLNAQGYPDVGGGAMIYYLEEDFKLALYPDQASADANTGAIWIIDNILISFVSAGGQKITDVGDGTDRTDAVNVGQVQDSQFGYLGTTSGAADEYVATTLPEITSYTITQNFVVKIHATNLTTTPYIQLSSIVDPAVNAVVKKLSSLKVEIPIEPRDMIAGGLYMIQRNSSNNAWILLNPEKMEPIRFIGALVQVSINFLDSDHDIDFSAGKAYDRTNDLVIQGYALTKQIDAIWAAGNNQGGLDVGTVAPNTYYYCYVIFNPTSNVSDALISASATSPTLPSGYTYASRQGMVKTDGSGNIRQDLLGQTTLDGQEVYFQTGESQTGAITIPNDDTIPQNTEGNEFMTLGIAPLSDSSRLSIESQTILGTITPTNQRNVAALFQDSDSGALSCVSHYQNESNKTIPLFLGHFMKSGTVSFTEFKIRAGTDGAGTVTFNGRDGIRYYGGTYSSFIKIVERGG